MSFPTGSTANGSIFLPSFTAHNEPICRDCFLTPRRHVGWRHRCAALGGLAGVAGAALLVLQGSGSGPSFSSAYLPGYLAALGCAFTWSGYSLLSRRLGHVPSDVVGGFCGVTALLGLIVHMATELTV